MTAHPSDTDILLGHRLRVLREFRGWNRKRLAGALGMTQQQLSHLERGQCRLMASRVIEIAALLDFPVSAFFDGLPLSQETAHAA